MPAVLADVLAWGWGLSASAQKGPLTAMQIRLTVVDPLGPPDRARGRTASCDVLVTAPAGTALAAVASALASAVAGDGGAAQTERGRESGGPVVLYAGAERLDDRRCTLGEPPLTDGAVLSLGAPAEPEPHPELDDAPTQLHVVAGPDAGGVHLLHGGEIRIGRSADADVPLDDPDVSRLHCAVTVAADGQVSVADLASTNGTTLDGTRVGTRPVRFAPGALLRIGESALRVAPAGGPGARVPTAPDGEGHVRVPSAGEQAAEGAGGPRGAVPAASTGGDTAATPHARVADGGPDAPSRGAALQSHGSVEPAVVPVQGSAPRIENRPADRFTGSEDTPPPSPERGTPTPDASARSRGTHLLPRGRPPLHLLRGRPTTTRRAAANPPARERGATTARRPPERAGAKEHPCAARTYRRACAGAAGSRRGHGDWPADAASSCRPRTRRTTRKTVPTRRRGPHRSPTPSSRRPGPTRRRCC